MKYTSLMLITLLFTVSVCANDVPKSGMMELMDSKQQRLLPALLLESELSIKASGMIAMVEITQHFKNDSQRWVEGRYVFPLPEDAAVDGMELHIGNRKIQATIKEKQQAKKVYQQAKSTGKKAALLAQHRPNLFSQQVANIAPQEKITVKLRYLQPINYQQGVFSLRFPMTITPRYIPGQTEQAVIFADEAVNINQQGWGLAKPTQQVPDAHLMTPPITDQNDKLVNPITINVELDAGLPLANINSEYHSIVINKSQQQHHISLAEGKVRMDRDFVLSWQAIPSATPRAAVFHETIAGDDYSLLMLMPPSEREDKQAIIPREILFIIDTSGSMGGTSIRQAISSLQVALKNLTPHDRFNIIAFNSDYHLLYQQPVTASSNNIQQALHVITQLQAGGGTEMLPALEAALTQQHSPQHFRQVVFITDGAIGNEDQLFQLIHQRLGKGRLFTIGIGSAPNSFFMRKAAEIGRGTFTYIGDINEVNQKMSHLFEKIHYPTMKDITITDSSLTHSSTINSAYNLEVFPNPITDLYYGQPLIFTLRKDYELTSLTIKGIYKDQSWKQTLALNNGKQHSGVAKLWARYKIESLSDQERLLSSDETPSIKQQIIDVALTHQLVSQYTSFVAVEETISNTQQQPQKPMAIANKLAKGQQLQAVNYPQTATPLWLNILLGMLALVIAILISRGKKLYTNSSIPFINYQHLLRKRQVMARYIFRKKYRNV